MERPVKERLVGAAVLVAAAVILIPEMLSGPQRNQSPAQVVDQGVGRGVDQGVNKGGEPPLKTYTIDLSRSPAAQDAATPESVAPPTVIEAPAPPPETIEPPAADGPASSEPVAPHQETPEPLAVEKRLDDATSVDVAPPAMPPANYEATEHGDKVTTQRGWAVQLASFDSQAAANSMSRQLRDKGYDAFVMPFKKGGTTWYRVRIGPVKDRQAAGELQRKVKETTPGAIVVPHP